MATNSPPRIIAGFARSGTTWIQDVLAESNGLRPIFEPLHPKHVPGAGDYAHRYLSASDSSKGLRDLLDPFFFGDYRSLWVDYRIVRKNLYPKASSFVSWDGFRRYMKTVCSAKENVMRYHPQRRNCERIVKFVRANMMLSWLKDNFAARIVFVIRHPAAVVLSQISAPRAWDPRLRIERYRNDPRLLKAVDEPIRTLLFETSGDVEAYTLSWCIENAVALAQAAASGIHIVYYEGLLTDAEREWSAILAALGLSTMPAERLIQRPSQQTWGEKAADASLIKHYGGWMDRIDPSVRRRIQGVLERANMCVYGLDAAEPKTNL